MDEADRFWQEWRKEADRRFGKPRDMNDVEMDAYLAQYATVAPGAEIALILGRIDERLARIEDVFEKIIALSDNGTVNEDGSPRFRGMT